MIHQVVATVLYRERLPGGMALLVLQAPDIAAAARPGQFVMVRCGDLPLRRPLSIHAAGEGRLALLFRVAGTGTSLLAELEEGANLSLTGPLGNGYTPPAAGSRVVLLAGGLGIAPLYFLAARLSEPRRATLVHGARTANELYRAPERLRLLVLGTARVDEVEMLTATDDGTSGAHATALDAALPLLERATNVYVCGPVGMCVAASTLVDTRHEATSSVCSPQARERLAHAEVSLEVRMGCGVGACYGCSIPTLQGRRKVCVDGPVFRFGDVLWDEVVT